MNKKIIVAIDGHSSCGKSTMARKLAAQIGYVYVDTGAMYRGVTLYALRHGYLTDEGLDEEALRRDMPQIKLSFKLNSETARPDLYLNGKCVEQEIRSLEVGQYASRIATLDFVREALTAQQQAMGRAKGIVMDGRDIGTNVFPEAELKVFVTASPMIRAERRRLELLGKGEAVPSLEEICAQLQERDYRDSHRAVAPLRQAPDAIVLDNSHLSIEEQHARLVELFAQASSTPQP